MSQINVAPRDRERHRTNWTAWTIVIAVGLILLLGMLWLGMTQTGTFGTNDVQQPGTGITQQQPGTTGTGLGTTDTAGGVGAVGSTGTLGGTGTTGTTGTVGGAGATGSLGGSSAARGASSGGP